jgi:ribA/ribD-fused uncharacterized protein
MIVTVNEETLTGDFSFLSNFYMAAPFEFEGATWPSAEHAFQASKCADPSQRKLFVLCKRPGEAKRLGRRVRLRADWESVKLDVMEEILRAKFRDASLRRRLAAIGTCCHITHTNIWHDLFWGVCACPIHNDRGRNHLGQILMKLRSELP